MISRSDDQSILIWNVVIGFSSCCLLDISETLEIIDFYSVIYHGFWKDQRIVRYIPCYVTMDYEKWFLLTRVKKSVHLKFKIMSITWILHVSDVVLTLYISYWHVAQEIKLGEALLFQFNLLLLEHFVDNLRIGDQRD